MKKQTNQSFKGIGIKWTKKKNFNDLVKERTKEIAELNEKIEYGKLMFVTRTERLYNFKIYRKPSIEASDL